MKYTIKAGEVYGESEIFENAGVIIDAGKIAKITRDEKSFEGEIIDCGKLKLLPGLIDIHMHGGGGFDSMDLSCETLDDLSCFKAMEGVTSFCPSPITSKLDMIKNVVKTIRDAKRGGVKGAKIIGSFIEGPYINVKNKGAHVEELIREINLDEIKEIIEVGEGSVKSFAIAPELPNAIEAIEYLKSQGVTVRIGHSSATCAEAIHSIDKGAKIGIHTFNAMSPFGHREVGMVGALLLDDRVYCEIICDLIHVCPEAIKILNRCKAPDRIVLITDCMVAGGLPDGEYQLGGQKVIVKDRAARLESGNLAGSTLALMDAVKNMHRATGVPLFDAVKMATQNPAEAMDIFDEVGSISAGKAADLTVIDSDFNVKLTIVDGEVKFNNL